MGKRILAYLDPDGVLAPDAEHQRRREFTLTALSDGSDRAHGYLTPTCGAQLLAVLDAHAAPTPAEDGTRDPRTHGQRMHDALETLAGFAVRRNELPYGDGATQRVITMTANDLATGEGLSEISFGQLISIPDALERRARAFARRRTGHEHRNPGRVQPGLEIGRCPGRRR